MKKYLYLFLFLLSSFSIDAQFTFTPNPLTIEADVNESETVLEFHLAQASYDSVFIYWKLEKDKFPTEWESQICDQFTCYTPNLDISASNHGNLMFKDSSYIWSMHLLPHGKAGEVNVTLKLYEDSNHKTEVASIPISLSVSGDVAVENENNSKNLSLFPNPSSDYFKVKNDIEIKKIAIYNIIGRKMRVEKHFNGQSHNVSDLQRGVYLVRLFDQNDNMLKVIRLTKK